MIFYKYLIYLTSFKTSTRSSGGHSLPCVAAHFAAASLPGDLRLIVERAAQRPVTASQQQVKQRLTRHSQKRTHLILQLPSVQSATSVQQGFSNWLILDLNFQSGWTSMSGHLPREHNAAQTKCLQCKCLTEMNEYAQDMLFVPDHGFYVLYRIIESMASRQKQNIGLMILCRCRSSKVSVSI